MMFTPDEDEMMGEKSDCCWCYEELGVLLLHYGNEED